MIEQFFAEYWMFVEALLAHSSELVGVSVLNQLAAGWGYPFAAALALSGAGFALAWAFLSLGRPGLGLLALAVCEELSALSLANAALAHGFSLDASIAAARVAAVIVAVCLVSAMLRKALLRPSPEKAPAGR
jgi:hypothetical protein